MRLTITALALAAICAVSDASPINVQPPYFSPTSGYIDPTASSANGGHPMVACASACSSALVNQNTDALQWAINQAAGSSHPWILIPPGQYPVFAGGASHNQKYDLLLDNVKYVTIRGYGATIRATGDHTAIGQSVMFQVQNGSAHIRFLGLTFSIRDLSGTAEEHSHFVSLGNGSTSWDDVQFVDCAWIEGRLGEGDDIQINGGTTQALLGQRLVVAQSWLDSHARAGLSFQHGTADVLVYGNLFGPDNNSRCTEPIHHEPTNPGGNATETYVGNVITCSQPMVLSFDGFGSDYNRGVLFARNLLLGGYITSAWAQAQIFAGNVITGAPLTTNTSLDLHSGDHKSIWIFDNLVSQDGNGASRAGPPIMQYSVASSAPNSGLWVTGNVFDYGDTTGNTGNDIVLAQASDFWVDENSIVYHGALANKMVCIGSLTEATGDPPRGWISGNVCRKDASAGLIDRAIEYSYGGAGAQTALGHAVIRDNTLSGGRRTLLMSYSASNISETVPIVSGNHCASGCSLGENEPSLLLTESIGNAETISTSGALSLAREATFVNGDCGTDTDTLGDGLYDGQTKQLVVYSSCASIGTVTPAHFGDGTSISWATTLLSPAARAELKWDATAGDWWLISSSNITVNP